MAVTLCTITTKPTSNILQGPSSSISLPHFWFITNEGNFRTLCVGKKRSPGVQVMVDEYVQKLKHYCSVEDVQIRSNPRNARDTRTQVDDEDKAVMNIVSSDDWVVMLDERGQDRF